MDFGKWKQKAKDFWGKVVELKDKTLDYTAQKISESSMVIKDQTELEKFILGSANKVFTSKDGEEKTSIKRVLLLVGDSKQDFYRDFLGLIPVLLTKWFTQNMSLKIVDVNNDKVQLSWYDIWEAPVVLVFENREVYKTISWEENVKKLVKSLTLDINKTIEDID